MKRRDFILDSLKAAPLLAIAPGVLLTQCKEKEAENVQPNSKKSVIVIGAGISGLAAAKKLKEKGFTVTVLEAQDKIGGRLRTDRSLGPAFDEGASWIHGPDKNPITDLASQAAAQTFLTENDSLSVFNSAGKAYTEAFMTEQDALYKNALNAVRSTGTPAESFGTVFNKLYPQQAGDPFWKYMLSAYLEFGIGGDISNLSAKYFDDDEKFSGKDLIITNGYDKIADFLGQGLDIRLNSRISQIDYSGSKVKVTAGSTVSEADFVLITVPLGVLKNKSLTFVPALPAAKELAVQNTKMGNVNKFLLKWNAAFWDTSLQYIGFTPDTKGKFNYFLNVKKFMPGTDGLMTFAFGNYADQTENMSDQEIIREIMTHLRSIYGASVPEPAGMLRTKWRQNINSFGAYSHATAGSSSADFDTLAAEVSNKLFFAGEHTERTYRGTVHGAYLSGIREADKIGRLL